MSISNAFLHKQSILIDCLFNYIRYLPVVLKQSETSHGSTYFHFAESGKELESTFLSPYT